MNQLFLEFDDGTDANIVFTKLRQLFPSVKKIKNLTILKEFEELSYKDDETDIKFEFISPHTVNMVYRGDEYVYIDDEDLSIHTGGYTAQEAIDEYTIYIDYLWERYVEEKVTNTAESLKERINKIKSKVNKLKTI